MTTGITNSLDYSKFLTEGYSLEVTDYTITATVKIGVKHLETASTIDPMKNIISLIIAI